MLLLLSRQIQKLDNCFRFQFIDCEQILKEIKLNLKKLPI